MTKTAHHQLIDLLKARATVLAVQEIATAPVAIQKTKSVRKRPEIRIKFKTHEEIEEIEKRFGGTGSKIVKKILAGTKPTIIHYSELCDEDKKQVLKIGNLVNQIAARLNRAHDHELNAILKTFALAEVVKIQPLLNDLIAVRKRSSKEPDCESGLYI